MSKGDPTQISVVLRDCTLYFSDDEDSEDWQKMLQGAPNQEVSDRPESPGSSIVQDQTVREAEEKSDDGGSQGRHLNTGHATVNGMEEEEEEEDVEEKEAPDVPKLHKTFSSGAQGSPKAGNLQSPSALNRNDQTLVGKSSLCRIRDTKFIENQTMHGAYRKHEENLTVPNKNRHRDKKRNLETLTTGQRPFLCDNCGITFTSNKLPLKLPSVQKAEELSSCPNCGSKCFQKQQAFGSQTADVVWNPHTCSECEQSFQNDDDLKEHQAFHLENPYWCSECERSFRSQQGLKVHRNRAHTGNRMFTCITCGKCFKKHHDLLVHRKIHRKRKKRASNPFLKLQSVCKDSHLCTVCHQSFGCASALLTHKSFHTEARPFTCTECGKSFCQNAHLVNHQRRHRQHQCLYCEKVITKNGYCIKHQNLNLGTSPQCKLCGKNFTTSFSLRRHESVQHSGENANECAECGKGFKNKYAFIMHQGVHLGEGPFTCTQCDTSFHLKTAFLEHIFGHTSEHLYTCVVCKKSFLKLTKLYEHQRLHTGEKPYACNLCHETFRRKDYVTIHLKKKHAGHGALLPRSKSVVDPGL